MKKEFEEEGIDYLNMVANIIAEMIENYEVMLENEANGNVDQYQEEYEECA